MTDARGPKRGRAGQPSTEQILEQRVEERTRELTALLEVSRSLSSTLALEPLLDLILDQLLRVIDFRSAGIFLADNDALETVAMRDTRDPARDRSQVGYRTPLAQRLAVWQAVLDGEPVVIGDVRRDDDAFTRAWRTPSIDEPSPTQSPVRAWMAVPLSARGQVFGMLALTRDIPDSFTTRDTELALAFAGHAAVAMDNARLLGESEERTSELSALLEVSRSLSSTLDLEPLLDVVLEQMQTVAEYDGASIVVLEDNRLRTLGRRATPRASTIPGPPEDVPIERAESWWRIVASGRAVILGDAHGDEPLARAYRAMVGVPWEQSRMYYVRSWMAAPLALQDRVIGAVILAHGDPHIYTQRHADLAVAIATQAAVAIENARLYERERRTAQELATLLAVARGAASTLEQEPLLSNILDALTLVVDYDGASIGVVDGDEFRFLEARGADAADRRPEMIGVRLPMHDRSGLWEPLLKHEPVIIADVRDDSDAAQAFRRTVGEYFVSRAMRDVRSFMIVPLVNRDRLVGLLTMSNRERNVFTQRHARLALAIATHIAAALENARLFDQTEQRAHELATLVEVSHAVASTLDVSPLLDLILEQLMRVVDYRGATLGTIDGEELLIVASRAVTPERERDRGLRFPLRRFGPIWEAIARGEPSIIADVRSDEPAAVEYRALNAATMDGPTHRDIRSWMAVPLALGDRVIGMLSASQDVPNYFTPHHAELALTFANQVAVALENARLFAESQGKAALEERQRLARELHDSVSQALFGIALGAGAARRRLDLDPSRVAESLDYVLSLADVALTEMRALIFELRPEALEKDGLVAALTRHAAATRVRHEVSVETALCDEPDVPLAMKEALYRIAQEAMHNAVKHARASRIDVILSNTSAAISLQVSDDGVGFDPSQNFAGHLGLHSMRERMTVVGGTTDITSAPGQGTCIRATVPVP